MKRALALISLSLFAAPDRATLTAIEKSIDRRMETMFDEPWLLLGMTRGVYLEGTGAVFTTEMSLALGPSGPMVSPRLNKEDMEKLRRKRIDRLAVLRTSMQDTLIRTAEMLPTLPPEERVVLGVTIFRKSIDDNTGIPAQIVMQAAKRELLEKNKAAIRTREF